MNYFGPYKHEKIDFSQLTQNMPLFLVSGNTGSGKTTIFDAMSYALFGQTTNDRDRDATALRSDFAPRDQESSVTLTFKHQNVIYQITRKPTQDLLGRRGKLVHHSAKVSLIYPFNNEEPHEISKINSANEFIEQLLNLNRDQFRQVVLLPQGKFRQFLESSSSDKENLLRDLFNTQIYERWSQIIKQRLNDQRKKYQTTITQIDTIKNGIDKIDSNLATNDWLEKVQDQIQLKKKQGTGISREIQNKQEIVGTLNQKLAQEQEVNKNLQELAAAQDKLAVIKGQHPQIEKKQSIIRNLEWYQDHQKEYLDYLNIKSVIKSANDKLKNLGDQVQDTKLIFQKVKTQGDQLAKMQDQKRLEQDEASRLTQQLPLYKRKKQNSKLVKDYQSIVQSLKLKLKNKRTDLEQLQDKLAENQRILQQQDRVNTAQLQLEKSTQRYQSAKSICNALEEQANAIDEFEKKIQKAKENEVDLLNQISNQKTKYVDLKDQYARNTIAVLVKDLKPGKPCPVCGSLEHPDPAPVANLNIVTEKEVNEANDQLVDLQAQKAKLQAQIGEWQTNSDKNTAHRTKMAKQFANEYGLQEVDLESIKKFVNDLQSRLTDQTEELDTKVQQIKNAQILKTELTEKVDNLSEEIIELQKQTHQSELELGSFQAALKTIEQSLSDDYQSYDVAKQKLSELQKRIASYEQQVTDNTAQQHEYHEKLSVEQSEIHEQQTILEQNQIHLVSVKEKLSQQLTEYSTSLDWSFFQWCSQHLGELTPCRKEVADYQEQLHKIQTLVDHLKKQTATKTKPDITSTQHQIRDYQQSVQQLQEQKGALDSQIENYQQATQQIARVLKQQEKQLDQITDLQTIADVMSGNTDNKLSLERYVLQTFLEEILQVANKRLLKLTNGRYAFKLSHEQGRGNGTKWSGLEINVYDDNAGQERSVRTLSGGESFMASLALALSLGEVIQEQNGGINIDALFVDEGFGSLDQEALNQAIQALQDIEGYQMIGIISHVTELENQIPDQLHVISQDGISHVEYRHQI